MHIACSQTTETTYQQQRTRAKKQRRLTCEGCLAWPPMLWRRPSFADPSPSFGPGSATTRRTQQTMRPANRKHSLRFPHSFICVKFESSRSKIIRSQKEACKHSSHKTKVHLHCFPVQTTITPKNSYAQLDVLKQPSFRVKILYKALGRVPAQIA